MKNDCKECSVLKFQFEMMNTAYYDLLNKFAELHKENIELKHRLTSNS